MDALEVLVREKFDLLKEGATNYFRNHYGGVDALGIALYSLMKDEHFDAEGETFEAFFIRMVNTGKLVPGSIQKLNDAFYQAH